MNFKDWILSEELYPNKTATVFHRTKNLGNVESIFKNAFKTSGDGLVGDGLYTTFSLESQFNIYMKEYGDMLIKFKVVDLDKYLIFQPSVAKYILGKENYTLEKQLEKLNIKEQVNLNEISINPFKWFGKKQQSLPQTQEPKITTTTISDYDKKLSTEKFSYEIAREFYKKNKWIDSKIHGVIYTHSFDGHCLVKYKPVENGITMIGYADAPVSLSKEKIANLHDNAGWITSTSTGNIKDKSADKELQRYKDISQPIKDILFKSAKAGNLDTFKKYFSKVNVSDISLIAGQLLYAAAYNNKIDIVNFIVNYPDPKFLLNLNDYSNMKSIVYALVNAAEKNDINMIKTILNKRNVRLDQDYIDFISKKTNNQDIIDYLNSKH